MSQTQRLLGRVVVTYQAWDTEGTPLADPPLVFELEESQLSQYRNVESIYGPHGGASFTFA